MTTTRELALTALEAIFETRAREERVLKAMPPAWPDLGGLWLNQGDVEDATLKLIDAILGNELGTYLICECSTMGDGGMIEVNGRKYPIRTVDDVRAYLDAEVPEVK